MRVGRLFLVLMLATTAGWPVGLLAASRDRYERVQTQAQQLRLDGPRPSPLSQIRRTIAAYETIARRYPSSGYADNALFQAATLARAAHRVYGSEIDRAQAQRFLQWLVREYPASSLKTRAQAMLRAATPATRVARAATTPPAAATLAPASLVTPAHAPAPARTAESSSNMVSLRDVRREMVGGIVRVTLVFDGEVSYHKEELANPSRLYFDLAQTMPTPALQDAALSYDGPTARHIRLGRPRGQTTTRVVIDTQGAGSYTVFALYNPYRLAIDMVPGVAPAVPAVPMTTPAAPVAPAPPPTLLTRGVPPPAVDRVPGSKSAALTRPTQERLAPRPLPHPLADRPLAAKTAAAPRNVVALLRPPVLIAHPLLARFSSLSATPLRSIAGRSISAPVYKLVAAERTRAAAPLARRTTPPSTLPAPASPVPNSVGGFSLARQLGLGISRIVIDPGHGGHDPGAMAQRTTEAEIVLDVALRLEKLLKNEPGVDVVLTRRTNVFIPLEERPAIANREGADLFLSIHVNSSRNTRAGGVETYFLNFANNAEAEAVAARENATAARSMHQLPDMLKAISLNNKLDESRDFARTVQEALVARYDRDDREASDRGVKQAPFVVLIGANMPSILAEIGFITNADEGGRLRTNGYRQQIAQNLFEALQKYQRALKGVGTVASQ
jgi:N-acetylmuramoyl-L-alanine amidase